MIFRHKRSETTPLYKTQSSQSWGRNVVIAVDDMRPVSVQIAVVVAVVVVCCLISADGYQIAVQETDLRYDAQPAEAFSRQKRQMETFDDEDLSAQQQQEPEDTGFWDRVVRVAIKIFSRFVEWLNS